MGDETPKAGSNSGAAFKARVDRRLELFKEADELALTLADYKAEDKSDGFNEKVIAQVVKEHRADAEKRLKILTHEAEVDAARNATGLPTDLETAMRAAKTDAESAPEPKKERTKKGEKVVPFGKPDKSKH